MRSRILRVALLLTFGAIIVAFGTEAGDSLFVQVRQTPLRTAPSFLSPSVATLEYGSAVVFRSSRGDWYEVARDDEGLSGWIFADAVERDGSTEVVLQGERTERRTVTGREVALAGRGFSKNLEQAYADQQQLDFEKVDAIEARMIPAGSIISFIEQANLRRDFLEEAE